MADVKDILAKYSKKLEQEAGADYLKQDTSQVSSEYYKFKQDLMPDFSRYERWVKNLGSIIKIKVCYVVGSALWPPSF